MTYSELLKARGELELKFPKLSRWREKEEESLRLDRSLTVDEFNLAMCQLQIEYKTRLICFMEQKNLMECEIRAEIERMNSQPENYGVIAAYNIDGKVNFGKAFIHVVNKTAELDKKLDRILEKLDGILVDNFART